MSAPSDPLRQAGMLEIFTGGVFDGHARLTQRRARWVTATAPTKQTWRARVGSAARAAFASQVSPLAREPLPNAPDPFQVFADCLALDFQRSQTTAQTPAGIRRARMRLGGAIHSVWYPAVTYGLEALQQAEGVVLLSERALVLTLPDLTAGAAFLDRKD